MFDGEDITERMSVTEAMALKAALRTSCEHPGFTMVRTWKRRQKIIRKEEYNMTQIIHQKLKYKDTVTSVC